MVGKVVRLVETVEARDPGTENMTFGGTARAAVPRGMAPQTSARETAQIRDQV